MAIKLYGGETPTEIEYNYNREFTRDNGDRIVLNEFVGISEDGEDIVEAKISDLKNIDVIISQSKDNDYMKQAKREVDIAYLQAMPPSPTNTGFRAIAEADLARNMDGITPDQQEQIDEIAELAVSVAKKQLVLMDKQLDQNIKQTDVNMAQLEAQQSMPPQMIGAMSPQTSPAETDPAAQQISIERG
jgi:hypothetical protein